MRIFTISFAFKLTSAGLPAPSITIMSKRSSKRRMASFTVSNAFNEYPLWYSRADILPIGFPIKITCEQELPVGFNNTGFISTNGSSPAASACATCARPISSPSFVTYEFKAIFCALNGTTLKPS